MSSKDDGSPKAQDDTDEGMATQTRRVRTPTGGPGALSDEFAARYVRRGPLGHGGMGTVDRYFDTRLQREVALKTARVDEDPDTLYAAFVAEAVAQARVEHPAVVPVYDLGVDDDGRVYFTMKRVQGLTLADVIDGLRAASEASAQPASEGTPAWSRRALLVAFSRVCLAVDYAHARGVLHCDLKPANLMFGEFGEVYVLDWGVSSRARPRGDADGAAPSSASGSAAGGTPGYMAPEQVDDGPVGPAADVYALGAILYELLTLQRYNPGATPQERNDAARRGDAPPASERAPDREIPPELDVACMRATMVRPSARYPSARRLAEAIEAYLDGQRDLAVRAELARRHAEAARAAVEDALSGGGLAARRTALAELGRTLALDPSHADASALLARLVTEPPPHMPPEAERALAEGAREHRAWSGRIAAFAYLSLVLYWPLFAWAGIRDALGLMVFTVLGLLAAAVCGWVGLSRHAEERDVLVAAGVSTIAMATSTILYGPLVLTPMLIAVNTTAYAVTLRGAARGLSIVFGVIGVLVPIGLELAAASASSYAFAGGAMAILPGAIEIDAASTTTILAIAGVAAVLTGALTVGRLRDALDAAERRLQTYAWHFGQLVPTLHEGREEPGTHVS